MLDILLRNLEIIYYKTTPPIMFQRPFVPNKREADEEDRKNENAFDPKNMRIDGYVAQEIAREHLDVVMMHILEIVLDLLRVHRSNSEKVTKYFGILY